MNFTLSVRVSLVLVTAFIASAAASAQNCSAITAVPITINTAGSYCLTQNLRYEGVSASTSTIDPAIHIASNDVTLDFNGFGLVGGGNASANANSHGVYSSSRSNIVVRGGAIRGFGRAVSLDGVPSSAPVGNVVERMQVNDVLGVGIKVVGDNAVIRDNRINNVTSTVTAGNCDGLAACGIVVRGAGVRILGNAVANVIAFNGEAAGIYTSASGTVVQDNSISSINPGRGATGGITTASGVVGGLIRNNIISNSGASAVTGNGIYAKFASNVTVDGNTINGFSTGICLDTARTSKFKNNTVIGSVFAGYLGGTNIGNNSQ